MLTKDIAEALSGRLDGDGGIDVDRLVHPARDISAIRTDAIDGLAAAVNTLQRG